MAGAVVVASRNRRERVIATLARLLALPEQPRVVLVDDGSTDGTAGAVSRLLPDVHLVRLARPCGQSAARNQGVRELSEEIVAFCDDDSWLEPAALARAGQAFGRHSRLGLAAARVMVQPGDRLDPVSAEMAQAELGLVDGLDAPRVLGFLACGAVVRRSAFLDSGGFNARYGGGGEEQLLAIDMSARGWDLAYLDDVVAHHEPAQDGRPGRRHRQLHNDLWTAWLRRPLRSALRRSARLLADAEPLTAARGLAAAAAGAPWLVRSRRRVPDELAAELERLG